MIPLLVLLAATPSFAAPKPTRSTGDADLGRRLDAYARPLVEADQLSGQLLVARHGEVLVERNYGYANWELRSPVTPETRFCIASVTKPMTGAIAIQLLQEKALGLGDSIAKWFPSFPEGNRIRVTHLLGHSSGIRHELVADSEATRPFTTAELVERAARLPLDHAPGAKSGYSSGGFSVLTRILELASGKPYATLLQERIFQPLGMTRSSDHDTETLLPGRASNVVPGPHGLVNGNHQDYSAIVGAGSVWSTARDLHRFVQGVAAGKLGAGVRYSYVRDGVIEFSGRTNGFRSYCDYDSASGLEVIFVGNLLTGAPDLLRAAIPRLAKGETVPPPAAPPKQTTPVTAAEVAAYLGTFALGNGIKLVMSVHDGVLYANEWVLLRQGDGSFFSPRDYGIVRGVPGDDGKMARLDWIQNGETYPAPRVAAAP
jgi:CubicO group peptidase (beta-lactamase class C family)